MNPTTEAERMAIATQTGSNANNSYGWVNNGSSYGLGSYNPSTGTYTMLNTAGSGSSASGQAAAPVTTISTNQGESVVNDNVNTLNTYQSQYSQPPPPPPETPEPPTENSTLTPEEQAALGVQTTPEQNEYTNTANQINNDYQTNIAGLNSLWNTTDATGQSMIASIMATFAARRRELEDINRRTLNSLQTSSIRSGTFRYANEVSTGLMAAQERANLDKMLKLDADEKSAILEAQNAINEKKYKIFVQKMEEAKQARAEKAAALKEFRDTVYKNEKDKKDREQKIADQINDVVKLAGTGGAPPQVLNKIQSSKNLAEAVAAGGDYLQGGTGIVGEYNYYKRDATARGLVPMSFDDYQTRDANRKLAASKAGVDGTGLNTTQQAVFNRIVDKYNASPAIKAMDRANQLKNIVAEIKKNPENPAGQLNLIYSYIKGLDTDSAVREGEIDLVKSINSYLGKFQLSFEKIASGKPITAKVALDIANGAEKLIETIEDTAKRKKKIFDAQAKSNGTQVYNAWEGFSKDIESAYDVGLEDINNEENAKNKIIEYGKVNPTDRDFILQLATQDDEELGRPLTYQEIMQYLQAVGKL